MAMALEGFQPIYGEARAEWRPSPPPSSSGRHHLRPFLFSAYAPDPSQLRILATDLRSLTFHTLLTTQTLHDLRDRIGVGGSWSEFVDYLVASLSSEAVKIVLHCDSTPADSVTDAKLVAHKSKAMPVVSISLKRLLDEPVADAVADLTFGLFRAFKKKKDEVIGVESRCYLLTESLAAEKDQNEKLKEQVEAVEFSGKAKQQKLNSTEKIPVADLGPAYAGKASSGLRPSKIGQRVVPTHRRTKVRGAILQVSGDADG